MASQRRAEAWEEKRTLETAAVRRDCDARQCLAMLALLTTMILVSLNVMSLSAIWSPSIYILSVVNLILALLLVILVALVQIQLARTWPFPPARCDPVLRRHLNVIRSLNSRQLNLPPKLLGNRMVLGRKFTPREAPLRALASIGDGLPVPAGMRSVKDGHQPSASQAELPRSEPEELEEHCARLLQKLKDLIQEAEDGEAGPPLLSKVSSCKAIEREISRKIPKDPPTLKWQKLRQEHLQLRWALEQLQRLASTSEPRLGDSDATVQRCATIG